MNEPSDLGAAGIVADALAAADAARMAELDRLIKAGKGSVAPQPQDQEDPMPCSNCHSKDHNARTCPERAAEKPAKEAAPAAAKRLKAPARAAERSSSVFDVEAVRKAVAA